MRDPGLPARGVVVVGRGPGHAPGAGDVGLPGHALQLARERVRAGLLDAGDGGAVELLGELAVQRVEGNSCRAALGVQHGRAVVRGVEPEGEDQRERLLDPRDPVRGVVGEGVGAVRVGGRLQPPRFVVGPRLGLHGGAGRDPHLGGLAPVGVVPEVPPAAQPVGLRTQPPG